jgi:hypothetical protein
MPLQRGQLVFAVEGGALQPKTCQKAQQNQFCMASTFLL